MTIEEEEWQPEQEILPELLREDDGPKKEGEDPEGGEDEEGEKKGEKLVVDKEKVVADEEKIVADQEDE